MAIGTAAAIGLGVAGIGSVLSAKSNRKAATQAADTSAQVARENNTLARENRDLLMSRADPYINSGQQANTLINSILGFGSPQTGQPTAGQARPMQNRFMDDNVLFYDEARMRQPGFNTGPNYMSARLPVQRNALAAPQVTAPAAPSGMDAFRQYILNSDYAFQFGEGADILNSAYAGRGVLQSGDAVREAEKFKQNIQSGYRNEYMDRLSGQQGAGLSALGAAAGVGTNYVSQVSQNNNNAGTAAANAALLRGANNPFANALGLVGGGAFAYGAGGR